MPIPCVSPHRHVPHNFAQLIRPDCSSRQAALRRQTPRVSIGPIHRLRLGSRCNDGFCHAELPRSRRRQGSDGLSCSAGKRKHSRTPPDSVFRKQLARGTGRDSGGPNDHGSPFRWTRSQRASTRERNLCPRYGVGIPRPSDIAAPPLSLHSPALDRRPRTAGGASSTRSPRYRAGEAKTLQPARSAQRDEHLLPVCPTGSSSSRCTAEPFAIPAEKKFLIVVHGRITKRAQVRFSASAPQGAAEQRSGRVDD